MRPVQERMMCFVFLSVILCACLHAQPARSPDPEKDILLSFVQKHYGLDQELYNGFQYYAHLVNYKGDPFFPEDAFYEASVCMKGVEYDQLRLKYNAYSQSLILGYTDFEGRYNQITLISTRIDSFRLGEYRFRRLSLLSGKPLFYQELQVGPLCCYIHWRKDINATRDDLQYSNEYSRALATFYLQYKGELHSFSNRSSYLSLFPVSMQSSLKKYFRQEHLSLKKAVPSDIQNLLVFTKQLTDTMQGP